MRSATWRARFDRLLAPAESPPWSNRLANGTLMALVLVSVVAAVVETVEDLPARITWLLRLVESFAVAAMAVEYVLRLWTAPEREAIGTREPWSARLHYALSFVGLVDLFAVLPALLAMVVPIPADALRLMRVLRLLKLARYTPALPLFGAVIRNESRALLATLLVVVILLVARGVGHVRPRARGPAQDLREHPARDVVGDRDDRDRRLRGHVPRSPRSASSSAAW